jgi:hypothetical protein
LIYQDAGAEVFTREKIKATKTTTKKTKTKKKLLLQRRQEKQENKSHINHT